MSRSARARYTEALNALLRGRIAALLKARDWELLAEVARLAQEDAPTDLAVTDPALFEAWRNAVTRYHRAGWTNMTQGRICSIMKGISVRGKPRPLSIEEVVPTIIEAVRNATDDSLLWSRGTDIFDQGIESVMEVYSAKAFLEQYRSNKNIRIYTQRQTEMIRPELVNNVRKGRIDLTLEDSEHDNVGLVEFKRYVMPSSIKSDLERVSASLTCLGGRAQVSFGLVAGPMITNSRDVARSGGYRSYDAMIEAMDFEGRDMMALQVHKGAESTLPIIGPSRDIQFPIVVSVTSKS